LRFLVFSLGFFFVAWHSFDGARNADPKSHQPKKPVKNHVPIDLFDAVHPECHRDRDGQKHEH
jgi:hypothetical protein